MLTRRRLLLGGTALAATTLVSRGAQGSSLDPDVYAWLEANARRLTSAAPDSGFDDIAPLRARLADARILSLGEATHGTHEFFTLKHRLIEYGVAELGFTMIAFEADYGLTLAVNDYVLHGKGNARDVVAGMGFWTWNTEEVVALVEWVRVWNLAHDRKVSFHGFDMQGCQASALHLLGYLERVKPELAAQSERKLAPLLSRYTDEFHLLSHPAQQSVITQIKAVLDAFEAARADWIEQAGEPRWYEARQCMIVLDQYVRNALGTLSRDRAMADNVGTLLAAAGPDVKALLWAHNAHVQRSGFRGKPNMGSCLHAAFGVAHVTVGFAFNRGSFQAKGCDDKVTSHTVGAAPDTFLEAPLAATGVPLLALDLARVPADGAVASWMGSKPLQRTIGALFAPEYELEYAFPVDPRENFDVLLFVENTTAARGIASSPAVQPGVPAAPVLVETMNPEPTNLALAGRDIPDGWHATNNSAPAYGVTLADHASPKGNRAVQLARAHAPRALGEGALTQIFPAAPWRGRRLVFDAAMRAEAPHIGTGAQLMVQVWPKQKPGTDDFEGSPILALQPEGLVRTPDWVRPSITVDIPADAEKIQISLVVNGNTTAWFGDLELAVAGSASSADRPAPLNRMRRWRD